MTVSRRKFLKMAGMTIVGGVAVYTTAPRVLAAILRAEAAGEAVAPVEGVEHAWAFVVDIRKCIGCNKCLQACKLENSVPPAAEHSRTWQERYEIGEDGAVFVDSIGWGETGPESMFPPTNHNGSEPAKSFFVPKLCNQCDNPPCVMVCPVSATFKTKDGVVLVDEKRCIGCKYCIQACPYGARFLNPVTKVADKCTWCYQRITKGLPPACVEVCPVGARIFGDLKDPESPVRKLLREEMTQVLKPALGTKPKVYYMGLQEGVR
ncbi:MAG: 4Fe-4S dicluster domain-containing protein [Chloroflexi bacterium]|nr:4Fe-4S dicluster domain-containing protein [Chloroflexota bacterium]